MTIETAGMDVFAQPERPGLVHDLPNEVYQAGRNSLSFSGTKYLLPPNSPADFQHRLSVPERKFEYDFGSSVHYLVLGAGPEIVELDYDNFRTKASQEERDAVYKTGKTPMLSKEMEPIRECAQAIKDSPIAGPLFTGGEAEVSGYWVDKETGVMLRFRVDYLTKSKSGRTLAVDLKTSGTSVHPMEFSKSVAKYSYFRQAAWYIDGLIALGHENPAFVFVAVSTSRPYNVMVCELDSDAIAIGRDLNRHAIELYASCKASGEWPGPGGDRIHLISLPGWATYQAEEILA